MNPGRYFMPNMGGMGLGYPPLMNMSVPMTRNLGIFGRLGNSIKSFNWSGLLSGANKTLNVVNQTIPLIRQTKPMINNMKSMFKLAKAFGSETVSKNSNLINNNGSKIKQNISSKDKLISDNNQKNKIDHEKVDNNYPNFFV